MARPLMLAAIVAVALAVMTEVSGAPTPSDGADTFVRNRTSFDYSRQEVMIPMRDGVKLKTVIFQPKDATDAPILLERTPYGAGREVRGDSPRYAVAMPLMVRTAAAAGYITVFQDVRGKYGSGGDYVLARPLTGPLNSTGVDHATDAYDTIEWLVKNLPQSNGRVATIGGSYGGFTALMSSIRPHPALRLVISFAPLVDGWIGDDWFHNGAFRQAMLDYVYAQEATRASAEQWWSGTYDTYDEFLKAGSAGAIATARGMEQLEFWRALTEHAAYDSFWQDQALDKLLAREPLKVPILLVAGLFDQEDIYGGPAVFKALAPKDPQRTRVHLVLGPWNHRGARSEPASIGPLQFEGDTGRWFRNTILQPLLDHHLRGRPSPATARALVYETGANEWQRYDTWPVSCAANCMHRSRALYLLPDGKLGFEAPGKGDTEYDEYISDPAKPVPHRPRPVLRRDAPASGWGQWLLDDQRHAASRPDVLVYATAPLTQPVRLAGEPIATLFASTTGSDADWVVKIIDVWPDEVAEKPELGGYQQMLSADILRGRYRENSSRAAPITPNQVLPYRIVLPNISHTFLPGHRIMVQIQSTWFPLYDRNPQTYVPSIMFATPESFAKATQRIWHSPSASSAIELPIVGTLP